MGSKKRLTLKDIKQLGDDVELLLCAETGIVTVVWYVAGIRFEGQFDNVNTGIYGVGISSGQTIEVIHALRAQEELSGKKEELSGKTGVLEAGAGLVIDKDTGLTA